MTTPEGETVVWQGHPSWKSMLLFYIKWTVASLIPVAVWVVLRVSGTHVSATIFFAVTVVAILLTYVVGWIKRATTRYMVTNRRISIRTGIAARNERTTHVDRVQNVHMSQGLFQRILGIGNVDWDTAGTDAPDADFTFRGIDDPSRLVQLVDRYHGTPVQETTTSEGPGGGGVH
jgi:uncharacterized membrane protein YdbT with pleckstrin-like domain